MTDGAMSKPLQDVANVFVAAMVVAALLLGWLNSRDPSRRGKSGSDDGSSSDDSLHHHHGWWGSDDADGGHHGDSGGDGH